MKKNISFAKIEIWIYAYVLLILCLNILSFLGGEEHLGSWLMDALSEQGAIGVSLLPVIWLLGLFREKESSEEGIVKARPVVAGIVFACLLLNGDIRLWLLGTAIYLLGLSLRIDTRIAEEGTGSITAQELCISFLSLTIAVELVSVFMLIAKVDAEEARLLHRLMLSMGWDGILFLAIILFMLREKIFRKTSEQIVGKVMCFASIGVAVIFVGITLLGALGIIPYLKGYYSSFRLLEVLRDLNGDWYVLPLVIVAVFLIISLSSLLYLRRWDLLIAIVLTIYSLLYGGVWSLGVLAISIYICAIDRYRRNRNMDASPGDVEDVRNVVAWTISVIVLLLVYFWNLRLIAGPLQGEPLLMLWKKLAGAFGLTVVEIPYRCGLLVNGILGILMLVFGSKLLREILPQVTKAESVLYALAGAIVPCSLLQANIAVSELWLYASLIVLAWTIVRVVKQPTVGRGVCLAIGAVVALGMCIAFFDGHLSTISYAMSEELSLGAMLWSVIKSWTTEVWLLPILGILGIVFKVVLGIREKKYREVFLWGSMLLLVLSLLVVSLLKRLEPVEVVPLLSILGVAVFVKELLPLIERFAQKAEQSGEQQRQVQSESADDFSKNSVPAIYPAMIVLIAIGIGFACKTKSNIAENVLSSQNAYKIQQEALLQFSEMGITNITSLQADDTTRFVADNWFSEMSVNSSKKDGSIPGRVVIAESVEQVFEVVSEDIDSTSYYIQQLNETYLLYTDIETIQTVRRLGYEIRPLREYRDVDVNLQVREYWWDEEGLLHLILAQADGNQVYYCNVKMYLTSYAVYQDGAELRHHDTNRCQLRRIIDSEGYEIVVQGVEQSGEYVIEFDTVEEQVEWLSWRNIEGLRLRLSKGKIY